MATPSDSDDENLIDIIMQELQTLSNLAHQPRMEQALRTLAPDKLAAMERQIDKLVADVARIKALNEHYKQQQQQQQQQQQPSKEDNRSLAEIHGHGGFSGCGFSSDEELCNRVFTSEAEDEFAFKARGWRHSWED